jgi:diguanylate cyclase (GGDEF)-like protein/PAS domain S-box-containing protein
MMPDPHAPDRQGEALIAIIDDRPTNRAIYARLAQSVAPTVRATVFADARTALDWLSANSVDLVITDFKMPGLNGAEFIREIRQHATNAEAPALVITAYDDRDFRVAALEAGATDFLRSPVDPHEFQTRVRNLLRLGRQQRMLRREADTLAEELTASEASRLRVIRQNRRDLAQVIDTVPAMIGATDRQGRLVFVNAYQAQLAGREVASLLGSNEALFGQAHQRASLALDAKVFETGRALPRFEEEITGHDGVPRWMLTTKAPLHDESGAVSGVLTTSIDITARREAERRLRQIAREDALTGVCSRSWFVREIRSAIAQSRRGEQGFALHFLDLDRFKLINDGRGHHVGDQLLRMVSSRIAEVIGGEGLIGRLGGDEFGILQTGLVDPEDAALLAARMLDALERPVAIEGQDVEVSASIGVAIYPRDGRAVDDLLRSADLAMYAVKIAGRRGYRLCGDAPAERAAEERDLERDLAFGLSRKQLLLHYQPQFWARSGELASAEALIRWNRPGWGVLSPGAFLPVAERCGLIGPITEWVVHEVTEQIARWRDEAGMSIPVAVNISPSQARRPDLAEAILSAAEAAAISPDLLVVEITEASVGSGNEMLLAGLARLRRAGVGICVDNFGLRELSLWALQQASVSRLKLDMSVVQAPETDDEAASAFERAASYGRILGAEIAAIGIETPRQLARVREAGCDIVQGALLSRPLEVGSLTRLRGAPALLAGGNASG